MRVFRKKDTLHQGKQSNYGNRYSMIKGKNNG